MKLLKVSFNNVKMFKDGKVDIDFFASDRVIADDDSVYEIKKGLYTNNAVAFAGINGSGKTVVLKLLHFVLEMLEGESLGDATGPGKSIADLFYAPIDLKVMFYKDNSFFVLSSLIQESNEHAPSLLTEDKYVFASESLYSVPKSIVTKSFLRKGFEEIISAATLHKSREQLDDSEAAFLSESQSFVRLLGLTRRPGLSLFESDYPFVNARKSSEDLGTLLRAFDPGIKSIEVFDEGRAYQLEFENSSNPIITNQDGLMEILSSGTLKGLVVIQFALVALKRGAYLLLDEIENHLNHQLVKLILNLFLNADTNPYGATLVFTTHYAEILDHLHRKDCIYFLPRIEKGKSEIVKYSSRVKRIENKKSEVFASNYVKGTAPSFREVKALVEYVKNNV